MTVPVRAYVSLCCFIVYCCVYYVSIVLCSTRVLFSIVLFRSVLDAVLEAVLFLGS